MSEIESQRAEIEALKRQVLSMRRELRQHTELLDTIASPPWKRLWFFLQGFRLWRLGVWYKARWNRSAWED